MDDSSPALLERLTAAVNRHDLDALAGCFALDYRNETPAHPAQGFTGRGQVRRNWEQTFTFVPDITARVLRSCADGGVVWSEWEMTGTRRDGSVHQMAGVIVFGVRDGLFSWARFYLEPVQADAADAEQAVRRHVRAAWAFAFGRGPPVIVVAGGTGTLGTRLVPRLAGAGLAVRVLTRDPARAASLAGPGVEVVRGDVRHAASLRPGLRGAEVVVSAVRGFAGPGGVWPASVDRARNANLTEAAARAGAAFVLVSVVGASPDHPIGLFRAKHAAQETLRASGVPWTIVRATAFIETWAMVMGRPLLASGKIPVLGRGDNPVNFVCATDVAALAARAVTDTGLRGQVLALGGPDQLTFNQFAALVRESTGRRGTVRHIPRPALRAMAGLAAAVKPALARQARAALAMDTLDMTFDSAPTRRAFPDLPETGISPALRAYWACAQPSGWSSPSRSAHSSRVSSR